MPEQFVFTFGGDGTITPPPGISVSVDIDTKTAKISFRQDEAKDGVNLNMDIDQLTNLIWYLGSLRAKMISDCSLEQKPPELELNNIAHNPQWYSSKESDRPIHFISFQHPSFGAVGCALFSPMAARLNSFLSSQLEITVDELLKDKNGSERA